MLGLSERTVQRWHEQKDGGEDRRHGPKTAPANKLSEHKERRLLRELTSPQYRDHSPRQVIPALAEQGTYIASEATAYRLLHKHGMQKHRTNKWPPTSRRPDELTPTGPNQVYCWDITYLKPDIIGTFYYLYLVTDIFSRRIVAARVYEAENDEYAAALFVDVHQPGQVTLHSDNGSPMKGATQGDTRAPRDHSFVQPPQRERRQPVRNVTLQHDEDAGRLPQQAI